MKKDRKFNSEIADIAREKIGKFLRSRRESLGMTQDQLAKCAGTQQWRVSAFEDGKANITINTLKALAGCLRVGVTFEEKDSNSPAGFEGSVWKHTSADEKN
jgi:transcriptional regulator with XRE-family HTH domain